MKIVICGPPHSGKSIFFTALKQYLPREGLHLFRACPDGEGTWSQLADQDVAQDIRRKGKFTPEFVSWVLRSIAKMDLPIVLVDVGGIRSVENSQILRQCDAFVVLCRVDCPEEKQAWEQFGQSLGLKLLASFDSALEGESEIEDETATVLRGIVTKLERGAEIKSITVQQLADRIINTADNKSSKNTKEKTMATMINLNDLAAEVKVKQVERQIRNRETGEVIKTVKSFNWDAASVARACKAVASLSTESEVLLDGGAPAFLYSALAHAVHPAPTYTADPKVDGGRIALPDLPLDGEGNDVLSWSVEEREDYTFVEFSIPGDIFDETNLDKIILPAVPSTKGLVISGRGPVYIHAALTRSYCHKVRWTATFSPQMAKDAGVERPAVVTTRHRKSAPAVGSYVSC